MEQKDCDIFKENVLILIKHTSTIVNHVNDKGINSGISLPVLEIASFLVSSSNNETLIKGFIERSYPHWDVIKKKDTAFLVENSEVLFSEIGEDYIKPFKNLFSIKDSTGKNAIDEELLKYLWEIIHDMIINCFNHIHFSRKPDPITKKYTEKYVPSVKLADAKKMWME